MSGARPEPCPLRPRRARIRAPEAALRRRPRRGTASPPLQSGPDPGRGSSGRQLALAEDALDLVGERAFVSDEAIGSSARALEQRAVAAPVDEVEIGDTGLARAQQLALASQLEVLLRELEAVVRIDERLQPFLRVVGQLLALPRDQQAVRLLRAATDAAPELMQLREAEPV